MYLVENVVWRCRNIINTSRLNSTSSLCEGDEAISCAPPSLWWWNVITWSYSQSINSQGTHIVDVYGDKMRHNIKVDELIHHWVEPGVQWRRSDMWLHRKGLRLQWIPTRIVPETRLKWRRSVKKNLYYELQGYTVCDGIMFVSQGLMRVK